MVSSNKVVSAFGCEAVCTEFTWLISIFREACNFTHYFDFSYDMN